jgi:DNA polymerase III alpha subunit
MKIDLLGLRTLTIIADCLAMIELEYSSLLAHPLDDDAAFDILRKRFFCGIFQFEGTALQNLTRTIKVDRFTDIVALTALARPGPLIAGSSYEWCARRTGRKPTELLHPMMNDITTETNGLIVFQEQMLRIIREIGMMSWEDTTALRKGMAKSMGLEYFERYWETFKAGALTNQIDNVLARRIWETVNSAGGYAFNKSHSVAYAMLSYWCCVLKSRAPLQFAVATLRNIGDADHIKAYLRELDRMGYEFKTFDAKLSQETWTIQEGKVIGGLMNVVGIGPKMAQTLIARREQNLPATEAQSIRLREAKTPFDNVFEARTKYADLLANPSKYGVVSKLWNISDLPDEPGTYAVMAKMTKVKTRSLNELRFLIERGGMKVTNDKWLTMTLEDDTDTIAATIARNDFQRLGMPLTKMKAGQWFIFRGNILENNRRLYINKYKVL